MNQTSIPEPDTTVGQLKVSDAAYTAETLHDALSGFSRDLSARFESLTVAAGLSTETNGSGSVALGYKAKSLAENAVQLGTGENSLPSSLKFMDTVIVNGTGKIPASSVSGVPKVAQMTRDEYEALEVKDPATLYIITEG